MPWREPASRFPAPRSTPSPRAVTSPSRQRRRGVRPRTKPVSTTRRIVNGRTDSKPPARAGGFLFYDFFVTPPKQALNTSLSIQAQPLLVTLAESEPPGDRKSTRLNSSHVESSYA